MVPNDVATSGGSSKADIPSQRAPAVTSAEKSGASPLQATGPFSHRYLGQTIGQYNLPPSTVNIICHSWRGGTRSQYDSAIRGWRKFCLGGKINPSCPSIEEILAYLTHMYESGMQYNTIASTKSALANVITIPGIPSLSEHPLLQRFLKGVYNLRPPNPRYSVIWDTTVVIEYLASLPTDNMSTKLSLYKTVMLLTLLSGQRVSTLYNFRIDEMQLRMNEILFNVTALLKHDRVSRKKEPIIFHAYPHDKKLCPVTLIKQYMLVRDALVPSTEKAFFVTHGKPYHAATKDTLARWVKNTMSLSGVDTAVFRPHNCRSASSSTAKNAGAQLHTILHSGQWATESTFYKFYQRQIIWNDITADKEFADSILAHK